VTTIQSGGGIRAVGQKAYPLPVSSPSPGIMRGVTDSTIALLRGDAARITYRRVMETQPLVHTVVVKRAKAIARNPLKAYVIDGDGARREDRGADLSRLMRRPFTRGTPFKLKAHIGVEAGVYGEALLVKERPGPGRPPVGLWPVPMHLVDVIEDESGPIAYRVRVGGVQVVLPPEEVVHFELPGGSPLRPLARTLALEDAAAEWQGQSFQNGMTKRGAFVTEQRITDAAFPRLRAELEQLYTGVENAGKIALLEQGLKFQEIGTSAVDADLLGQRKLSREEVCAAYDLNPALLGFTQANYGATVEHRRALFDSIATDLVMIEETLQVQLVDPEPSWDGLFVEFDTNEMLRPDPEQRARTHLMNQQSGVNSINERRRVENLPPIPSPWADAVLIPVNMLPVGEGVPDPVTAATGDPGGTPAQGIPDKVVSDVVTAALLGKTGDGDTVGTMEP